MTTIPRPAIVGFSVGPRDGRITKIGAQSCRRFNPLWPPRKLDDNARREHDGFHKGRDAWSINTNWRGTSGWMAPPLNERSQALGQDKRRTAQLDEFDLALANEHIQGTATNPEITTGFRNAHRDWLDPGLVFPLGRPIPYSCFRHTGRSFSSFGWWRTDLKDMEGSRPSPPSTPIIGREEPLAPHDVSTLELSFSRHCADPSQDLDRMHPHASGGTIAAMPSAGSGNRFGRSPTDRRRQETWKETRFSGRRRQAAPDAVTYFSTKPTTCVPNDGGAFISPS